MPMCRPDIPADYLQIRNIEIVRGDTFGFSIRLTINGSPDMLTESGMVTFAVFEEENSPVLSVRYGSAKQDEQGYINVCLTPEQTSRLRRSSRYAYELEWYINEGTVYTLLKGQIVIVADKINGSVRGEQDG